MSGLATSIDKNAIWIRLSAFHFSDCLDYRRAKEIAPMLGVSENKVTNALSGPIHGGGWEEFTATLLAANEVAHIYRRASKDKRRRPWALACAAVLENYPYDDVMEEEGIHWAFCLHLLSTWNGLGKPLRKVEVAMFHGGRLRGVRHADFYLQQFLPDTDDDEWGWIVECALEQDAERMGRAKVGILASRLLARFLCEWFLVLVSSEPCSSKKFLEKTRAAHGIAPKTLA